jgi:hypothetical protein
MTNGYHDGGYNLSQDIPSLHNAVPSGTRTSSSTPQAANDLLPKRRGRPPKPKPSILSDQVPGRTPITTHRILSIVPPIPDSNCSFCRGTESRNAQGKPEKMSSCCNCGRSGHHSCLNFTTKDLVMNSMRGDWRCIECKICEICETKGDDVSGLLL